MLHQLRDAGNTIVVIEHNLDVIKTADRIIDMGQEGCAGGGQVLVAGTTGGCGGLCEELYGGHLRAMLSA